MKYNKDNINPLLKHMRLTLSLVGNSLQFTALIPSSVQKDIKGTVHQVMI